MLSFIFRTNWFIKKGRGGCACGPLVFIRPEFVGDEGLLAHELEHVRQFWKNPFTHFFKYNSDRKYRLKCEVAAYRKQLRYDLSPGYAAMYLSEWYDLDINYFQALKLLTGEHDYTK